MTVVDTGNYAGGMQLGPEDGVKCVWFDEKNKPTERVFDAATIEMYVPPNVNIKLTRA